MPSGTVKWFNNAKGYGFILSSDGASDIFAHYSAINMDGYKTLKAGQEVTYDLIEGQKGLHATNIVPVRNGVDEAAEISVETVDEHESVHS
ncbi:MAG: cold shock domain-containing protein CspD [Porticoccaceae bacterium]